MNNSYFQKILLGFLLISGASILKAADFDTGTDRLVKDGQTFLKPRFVEVYYRDLDYFSLNGLVFTGDWKFSFGPRNESGRTSLGAGTVGIREKDWRDIKETLNPVTSASGYVHRAILSPDGQKILMGTSGSRGEGPELIVQSKDGNEEKRFSLNLKDHSLHGILFTPDASKLILILGNSETFGQEDAVNEKVLLFSSDALNNASLGEPLASWDIKGQYYTLSSMDYNFSPDGKYFVSKGSKRFDIFNLETKEHLIAESDPTKLIEDVKNLRGAMGYAGESILSYRNYARAEDRYIRKWDYKGVEIENSEKVFVKSDFLSTAFTSNGSHLIGFEDPRYGNDAKNVQIINSATGEVTKVTLDLGYVVDDVLLLSDRKHVVVRSFNGSSGAKYTGAIFNIDQFVSEALRE